MATATKIRRRETKNTYGLPQGEGLRREIRDWFRTQRKAVVKWLKSGGRIERKKEAGDLPDTFPDWDWFGLGSLEMSKRMVPRLESIWDEAGQQFTAKIGLDPDQWEVTNPKAQEAIQKAALAFCDDTNATTSQDLGDALDGVREALAKNLIEPGGGMDELVDQVNEIFDGAEKWRARRIAVSEASRAVHQAQELQAKESGVVTGFYIDISEDACPLCQTIARRVPAVKLGQPFAVIGDHPDYSSIYTPPLHPNCACSMSPILDTDKQPAWAKTLHDPEPEEQDYAEGEAPERAKPTPEEKPVSQRVAKPKPAEKVKPRMPQPNGPPVSDGIEVHTKHPVVAQVAKDTIKVIDSIHGDGNLNKIPLRDTGKSVYQGFCTLSSDGKPLSITINRQATCPYITIAHEIGHQLDYDGIPRGAIQGISRSFTVDPLFQNFNKAIDKSEAGKLLRSRVGKDKIEVEGQWYHNDKAHVDYLNQDIEIWARAYSQYIATKSGDKAMMAELDSILQGKYTKTFGTQWQHDDFKPIAKEIDKIFRKLGWIK